MKMPRGFLIIGVKNPCSSFSKKTRKKNPSQHGIGMLIIDDAVKKYNGSIERILKNGEFIATAVLSEVG